METTYPQTFVKGDRTKVAHNAADAVKARFEGYRPYVAESTVDYSELQAQAKLRGIPANQSKDALVEALSLPHTESASTEEELAEQNAANEAAAANAAE